MIRIDRATITLDVWDDTLGMRREVTFSVDPTAPRVNDALRYLWVRHETAVRLLAAKDGGDFGPLSL